MSQKFPVLLAVAAATLAVLSQVAVGAEPAVTAGSSSAGKPEHTPAPRPDVTITAQREELETRITAFVNLIAGSYFQGEALARWQVPVCPLVSGVPSQEGEFILARVSEIARSAGIELAREDCRPNAYILMTTQPQELLRGMEKRNHPFTFANAAKDLIEGFISTPRPVRVWYHTSSITPEGLPLLSVSYPAFETVGPGAAGGAGGGVNSGDEAVGRMVATMGPETLPSSSPRIANGANTWSQATHLSFNAIWEIHRVFVIVDLTRLQGVSRGQIADYVAMVALAQLKPDARLSDDPTILRLFDGGPQAPPAALSDWDQAFLKALYETEQKSHLQRSQIARAMAREVLH